MSTELDNMESPLARGFYSIREAADLIEAANLTRIRAWLGGYARSNKSALLMRDYVHASGKAQELSFYDLIEVRFVEFFRNQGVKAHTMRAALESAREVYGTDKPFATNKVRFSICADRKTILVDEGNNDGSELATMEEDPKLWDLVRQQYIFAQFRNDIEKSISFDPETHLATSWSPRVEQFPSVKIDPKIAYGKPVVGNRVPTKTIFDTWLAEEKDYEAVQYWYELSRKHVEEAINFESYMEEEREIRAA